MKNPTVYNYKYFNTLKHKNKLVGLKSQYNGYFNR